MRSVLVVGVRIFLRFFVVETLDLGNELLVCVSSTFAHKCGQYFFVILVFFYLACQQFGNFKG